MDDTAPGPTAGSLESPSFYLDLEELSDLTCLKDIKVAMEIVRALGVASLDDVHNQLDSEAIEHLCNPCTSPVDVSDPNFCLGLDLFLASIKTPRNLHLDTGGIVTLMTISCLMIR